MRHQSIQKCSNATKWRKVKTAKHFDKDQNEIIKLSDEQSKTVKTDENGRKKEQREKKERFRLRK